MNKLNSPEDNLEMFELEEGGASLRSSFSPELGFNLSSSFDSKHEKHPISPVNYTHPKKQQKQELIFVFLIHKNQQLTQNSALKISSLIQNQ